MKRLIRLFNLNYYMVKLMTIRNAILTKGRISSGPFAGILYINKNLSGRTQSTLLGTYEKELWPCIRHLNQISLDTIVNVGAGEGYYAAGFAVKHPNSQIYAFESNVKARALLKQNLEINQVTNVEIHGMCDIEMLASVLLQSRSTLLFMDVEGAELSLLDPQAITKLRTSYIVVELHDFIDSRISTVLRNRFESTHDIEEIQATERTLDDFPLQLSFPFNLIPSHYDLEASNTRDTRWDERSLVLYAT